MKQLLLVFILFVSTCLLGQNGELQMVKIDPGFTWENSTLAERESFYFNLPVVKNSDFHTHIRISLTGQIIDFFSNDNIHFEGILTNEITEYKLVKTEWGRDYKKSKMFFQKLKLDPTLGSSVVKEMLQTGQDSIPSDSLRPSWRWYHHCGSIKFQIKNGGKYLNQSFHCPWSQPDTTKFVEVVMANHRLLKNKFVLENKYNEFMALLIKGKTYSRTGYMMMYVWTDQEMEAWKESKPQRDYLKSIKDAIDSTLKAELATQNTAFPEMDCKDYRLIFNKRGRLEKISIFEYDKLRFSDGFGFYVEEKREIWKCKKRIRRMFREIDLSSFQLKYKIARTLRFAGDGGVQLEDKTIY